MTLLSGKNSTLSHEPEFNMFRLFRFDHIGEAFIDFQLDGLYITTKIVCFHVVASKTLHLRESVFLLYAGFPHSDLKRFRFSKLLFNSLASVLNFSRSLMP